MLLLFAAHCLAAVLAPVLVRWLGRNAFYPLALVPAAAAVWALPPWFAGDDPRAETFSWVPAFDLEIAFRADALAWMMLLIVGGVGALIVAYCGRYFDRGTPGLVGFAGYLLAFAASMVGLVLADDIILLYVFWELTTVFSYLLIGFDAERRAARGAATQAIVITTFGGLAMLVGLIMLGQAAGTFRLSELVADPPEGSVAISVALVLVLVGALSKSAIMPFGLWLPGAMAAPTPVSAFLHAAAMVKAGIYLLLRLTPAFWEDPVWQPVVLVLGAATMVFAGWRALRENDLKLLLAYGTVSQLGFMTVLVGSGEPTAALAGVTILLAHALFKAALFMVVGIIDHATGTRDLRELTGLGRLTPVLYGIAILAAASMAGLPTTLGFAGKEAGYEAFVEGRGLLLAALVVGSGLTAAYSLRFLWGAFAGKPAVERRELHAPGVALLLPPALLAVAGVVLGVFVSVLDKPLGREVEAYPGTAEYHLAPWHGFGMPLALSATSIGLGVVLFLLRRPLLRLAHLLVAFEPAAVYRAIMSGLNDAALQITGTVQRGSLPGYLLTITLFGSASAAVALASSRPWDDAGPWRLWDGAPQGFVALLTVVTAIAAVRAGNRGETVVLASASGYGVATLFMLQGAPDIALTQFLVETASLIVFVLVLRTLPVGFQRTRPRARRTMHVLVGAFAGLTAAAAAIVAGQARTATPISVGYPAAAEEAGGSNIVAVTLVDLRAWDTLGESSVVALAALGITSLVFARRRFAMPPRARNVSGDVDVWAVRGLDSVEPADRTAPTGRRRERTWIAGGATLAAERRSIIFEVVARLVFHTVLLLSIYLLFVAHSSPGGGFAGGIVAGLALVIRYLAGGPYELAEAAPVNIGLLLGVGLVLSTGTALGGLVWGDAVFQSATLDPHLPVLGHVHFTTSLLFDIGVYLIVVGLILDILTSLGAEVDRERAES
ncbi:Na+/H+ antiporter subunit A [Actinomadura flavalba]|uniref:Na+/H+ antiporter subunit A n=1 Tax=Actinomadura flavalba TaxID=1120938 RepID=UPI00036CAA53|nr:Na+/H+ antiporter subunit A [Actinomadura flavalba]